MHPENLNAKTANCPRRGDARVLGAEDGNRRKDYHATAAKIYIKQMGLGNRYFTKAKLLLHKTQKLHDHANDIVNHGYTDEIALAQVKTAKSQTAKKHNDNKR